MSILELQTSLDELSAWRKRELSQAHYLAENASSEDIRRYLCRAWVMVMYAHCDNFLKESSRLYINHIKTIPVNNYKPELVWLAIKVLALFL